MILTLHIVSALVLTLIGIAQLRTRRLHKIAGYGFAVCALIASTTGLALALHITDLSVRFSLFWGGIYLIYRTAQAVHYAKQRRIDRHAEQIVTIYGLILSALTVRIAIFAGLPALFSLWLVTIITLKATRYIASLIVGTKTLTGFPVDTAERSR